MICELNTLNTSTTEHHQGSLFPIAQNCSIIQSSENDAINYSADHTYFYYEEASVKVLKVSSRNVTQPDSKRCYITNCYSKSLNCDIS